MAPFNRDPSVLPIGTIGNTPKRTLRKAAIRLLPVHGVRGVRGRRR